MDLRLVRLLFNDETPRPPTCAIVPELTVRVAGENQYLFRVTWVDIVNYPVKALAISEPPVISFESIGLTAKSARQAIEVYILIRMKASHVVNDDRT